MLTEVKMIPRYTKSFKFLKKSVEFELGFDSLVEDVSGCTTYRVSAAADHHFSWASRSIHHRDP
jgi:hypothetical protein